MNYFYCFCTFHSFFLSEERPLDGAGALISLICLRRLQMNYLLVCIDLKVMRWSIGIALNFSKGRLVFCGADTVHRIKLFAMFTEKLGFN